MCNAISEVAAEVVGEAPGWPELVPFLPLPFPSHHLPVLPPLPPQVCDAISEVAAEVVGETPGWPELVPFLFSGVQSGQPGQMEAALNIFANLAVYMSDTFKQQLGTVVQVCSLCGMCEGGC